MFLKGVPLVGNLSVALEVALVLLLAAMAANRLDTSILWAGLVILISYLIYEYAKTVRDGWHDRMFVRTAAVRWSQGTLWRVFVLLVAADLVVVSGMAAFSDVDARVAFALSLPVVPFAVHAYAHRIDKDLNPVGATLRASKLLFIPALMGMALWL
jgi:hypothetical protein